MSDPLSNPYAPPAEPPAEGTRGPSRNGVRSNYAEERRSVAVLVLLCLVTFGFYPSYWYLRRAPFLDSLDADRKLGRLPWVSVAMYAVLLVLSFVHADATVVRLAELGENAASLVLSFRIAGMLRSDFARTGRSIRIATLGVFFFGCLYLQYLVNEAADDPGRAVRARE
jgi:hypothetical protein